MSLPLTSTAASLEELSLIASRISIDARRAIESFEMLEASNQPVLAALKDVVTDSAYGHGWAQNAARVMLALEVSRLFDQGAAVMSRQTKASFPKLAHLLADPAIQQAIIAEAQNVGADRCAECFAALREFDTGWRALNADPEQIEVIRKLRTLRDYEIAHSIYDQKVEAPTYRELFDLMAVAVKLANSATIAVGSGKAYFDDFQKDRRERSGAFWGAYVRGVKVEQSGP